MKLKTFSLITLLCGLFLTVIGIVVPIVAAGISASQGGSVGVIGGADGPTYQFLISRLMSGWPFCCILFGAALLAMTLFCLLFSKTAVRYCGVKTTLVSVTLSAVGGLGLVCLFVWYTIVAFGEMAKYPVAYPCSILVGVIAFAAFAALAALYGRFRKGAWSVKGVAIDACTTILWLPAFFFAFSYLYELLR